MLLSCCRCRKEEGRKGDSPRVLKTIQHTRLMKVLEVERRDWETVRHGMASCISGAEAKYVLLIFLRNLY